MGCVFCDPEIRPWVLWEGNHYRIVADAFPRIPGHILLITRGHVVHHADAPWAWWSEFESALDRMRRFLLSIRGEASFWENGNNEKEVLHAHLHGMPVALPIASGATSTGDLLRVTDWGEVRRLRQGAGGYTLMIGDDGRYLTLDRAFWLNAIRRAVMLQTGQTLDPRTGGLRRGGPVEVAETKRLWMTNSDPGLARRHDCNQ